MRLRHLRARTAASRSRRGFLRIMAGSTAGAGCAHLAAVLTDHPLARPFEELFGRPFRALAAESIRFRDVAPAAGLGEAVNVSGSPTEKSYLLEEMGCGAAFFDYDQDGWLDIFLVNGSSFEGTSGRREPRSYLFHNNRDGTFTDVTLDAGLGHAGWGQGCCVGDYDNDGFDDLFVTYWGRNVLYRNQGDGTFRDVSREAGVAGGGGRWGAGCCFLDYDRDGFLDLFVANYVNFDPGVSPEPGGAESCWYNDIPVACGPQGFAGGTNALYRNLGNGTFEDVSEQSGIAVPRGPDEPSFAKTGWRPRRLLWDGGGGGGPRQRRMARYLRRPATRPPACSTRTTGTAPSGKSGSRRVARSTRTVPPWLAWVSASRTSTVTAGSTSFGPTSRIR